MDDLYQEHILDHFQHPRKKGVLEHASCYAEAKNLSCGDSISLQVEVDDQGSIQEIGWQGQGCAISQATASMLAETIVGKPLQEVQQLTLADIQELLGVELSPSRVKCALLFLNALQNCVV